MADPQLDIAGPPERPQVILDHWTVPFLGGRWQADGDLALFLDGGRHQLDGIPAELAPRLVQFLANAIALAQGFQGHPRGRERQAAYSPLWPSPVIAPGGPWGEPTERLPTAPSAPVHLGRHLRPVPSVERVDGGEPK